MQRDHVRLAVVVLLLVVALFSIAWNLFGPRKIDPTLLSGPYQVRIDLNGDIFTIKAIPSESAEGQTITAWLTANCNGWRRSFTTYIPHHTIETNDFDLNIHPNGLCILNIKRKGQQKQLTREFIPEELQELLEAIRAK